MQKSTTEHGKMGIGVRPREHLERTSEGLCACACTSLCVAVVDSWSCTGGLPSVAGEGLCLHRPLLPTAPAPAASAPAKEKGSPSDDPYSPTNGGEERLGGRQDRGRQEAGGRRRRNWSATNPDSVSAADLCSRVVGPACCFPRPPALLSWPPALLSRVLRARLALFPLARRTLPRSRAARSFSTA
jgi:hypothetical protein